MFSTYSAVLLLSPPANYFAFFLVLKGHGNEAGFLGFLHKPVRHRSITLRFEPFRFWLQIRGDICNRKTTPQLAESGVNKNAYRYNFFKPLINQW
jgi:hypothetical protein